MSQAATQSYLAAADTQAIDDDRRVVIVSIIAIGIVIVIVIITMHIIIIIAVARLHLFVLATSPTHARRGQPVRSARSTLEQTRPPSTLSMLIARLLHISLVVSSYFHPTHSH